MAHTAIIGAGLAGLAASLFLARRGHSVTLMERDDDRPPDSPLQSFDQWRRSGVAQRRQSHAFLARSSKVLRTEAPDVVDAMVSHGAYARSASVAGIALDEDATVLAMRRLVYESILRGFVEREPAVEVVIGTEVSGLISREHRGRHRVVGVRTAGGDETTADLVVDASGRHSRSPVWLRSLGCREVPEKTQECGFFYLTRWYQLRRGAEFPDFQPPTLANLGYMSAMAFAADNDHFSLTTIMSVEDPLRLAIRGGEVFDRLMAEIPLIRPWVERGVPISEAEPLSRIDNRRRKLVDASGPIVSGFVLLGDAAVHTNPTLARGVSLAFMHAQHLADSVEKAATDPDRYAAEFAAWTSGNLGIWFNSQVANDAANLARLRASLRGDETPPQPTDPAARFTRALFALADREPAVGLALARIGNLLISPVDIMSDQAVVSKVMAFLASDPDLTESAVGPSRSEFEAIVAGGSRMRG